MTALLDMANVSKRFGGVRAVQDVSLAVGEGEILGLIGPNGAGKSTVFNLINGVYPPDSGRIVFAGDIRAGEHDAPGVGRIDAVDQVEHGRLAGAVRAYQAEDLALADRKTHVLHGAHAAEALRHIGHVEQRVHSSHFRVRGNCRWIRPISPPGTNSTMTSNREPATTSWKCENVSETSSRPRSSS